MFLQDRSLERHLRRFLPAQLRPGHVNAERVPAIFAATGIAQDSQGRLRAPIYSASPCVSAAVLRALAKSAGVHVYVDEDAVVYANASLLSVTVVAPGRRHILMPQPVDVVDAISGQQVAEQANSFECHFEERESRLFLYVHEPATKEP